MDFVNSTTDIIFLPTNCFVLSNLVDVDNDDVCFVALLLFSVFFASFVFVLAFGGFNASFISKLNAQFEFLSNAFCADLCEEI